MESHGRNQHYPREISGREREWLDWILPRDRPGYKRFKGSMEGMTVIGEGRRGKGEVVLGKPGDSPEFSEPFGAVFAYGGIETSFGMVSITVREPVGNQISLEIVSHRSEEIFEDFEESRRWTYSTWNPGSHCPQCSNPPREVPMRTPDHLQLVLALCVTDRRLWVYDSESRVNRLIPVTHFYNELMLHKSIRDPKIALDGRKLFSDLGEYTDADLTYAFFTYNKLKTKVHIAGPIEVEKKERSSLVKRLTGLLKVTTK